MFGIHFLGHSRQKSETSLGFLVNGLARSTSAPLQNSGFTQISIKNLATQIKEAQMADERSILGTFLESYLDFLEGSRDRKPSIDDLPAKQRRAAEAFVDSITAARGIDPYSSRPSIDQLLTRAISAPDRIQELGNRLQRRLNASIDSKFQSSQTRRPHLWVYLQY